MSWFDLIASVTGDWISADKGATAAERANKTNLQLARENRDWMEEMSDTAVQRRRRDIEAAGFNPVLAATGAGASTPSQSSPTVEPTFRPEWTKGSVQQALSAKANIANINANTALQLAQAKSANVEADIRSRLHEKEFEVRANKFVEQYEWDNTKSRILRLTERGTAAQVQKAEETVDALIKQAKQDQEKGKLDLDALRNIAEIGGIEAGKMTQVIKLIIDLLKD